MNNNGLQFENSSVRLNLMVGSRLDRSSSLHTAKPKHLMSPSKTTKDLSVLMKGSLLGEECDGGRPAHRRESQNKLGAAPNQRNEREKPLGRPVGFRTMNDVEFQKYQRSLFLGPDRMESSKTLFKGGEDDSAEQEKDSHRHNNSENTKSARQDSLLHVEN